MGDWQHNFCIDIWFSIITSNRRSVLLVLQPGRHRVEGICCQSRGEWGAGAEQDRISLRELCAARWSVTAGVLALARGGEATPVRQDTGAEGACGGSSRRVAGTLGRYMLAAFTGTCHRSPAGAGGLG